MTISELQPPKPDRSCWDDINRFDKAIRAHPQLTLAVNLVVLTVLRYVNRKFFDSSGILKSYPGVETIAAECNLPLATVRYALWVAQRQGIFDLTQRGWKKRHAEYTFNRAWINNPAETGQFFDASKKRTGASSLRSQSNSLSAQRDEGQFFEQSITPDQQPIEHHAETPEKSGVRLDSYKIDMTTRGEEKAAARPGLLEGGPGAAACGEDEQAVSVHPRQPESEVETEGSDSRPRAKAEPRHDGAAPAVAEDIPPPPPVFRPAPRRVQGSAARVEPPPPACRYVEAEFITIFKSILTRVDPTTPADGQTSWLEKRWWLWEEIFGQERTLEAARRFVDIHAPSNYSAIRDRDTFLAEFKALVRPTKYEQVAGTGRFGCA